MKKILGKLVLFLTGWKSTYPQEYHADKCVMLAAPHTSNWDLLFAMAVYWKEGINNKFFIKDMYTKGFFGFLFKWLGAIGVDRNKKNNLVEYAVELFKSNEELVLMVPAEGTRKRVEKWRTGFYHIATKAEVPVALGFLDYKKKLAGVGKLIKLTGNFDEDMTKIASFYKDITGKYPELYNEKIF